MQQGAFRIRLPTQKCAFDKILRAQKRPFDKIAPPLPLSNPSWSTEPILGVFDRDLQNTPIAEIQHMTS